MQKETTTRRLAVVVSFVSGGVSLLLLDISTKKRGGLMLTLKIVIFVIACIAFIAVITTILIGALRRRAMRERFEKALHNPGVGLAARFWRYSLMQETHEPAKLCEFERLIQRKLAQVYAETKKFPRIGIGYYGPKESVFGLDELLWSAMQEVGFVNGNCRDIDHQRFQCSWGQMSIDFERVVFRLTCIGSDKEEHVLWLNTGGVQYEALKTVQVTFP